MLFTAPLELGERAPLALVLRPPPVPRLHLPAPLARAATSPTPPLLLLLLLFLLLPSPTHAVLPLPRMFLSATLRRARSIARAWAPLRDACEATPACAPLAEGEEEPCVLRCLSPRCWELVYAADPLEPGQVDKGRAAEFDNCLKRAEGTLRSEGLWPPRLNGLTGALLESVEAEVFTELVLGGEEEGEVEL